MLKPIDLNEGIIEVGADSALKEFVVNEQKDLTFKRCHFFYEFTGGVECITEDQKLIFVKKVRTIVSHATTFISSLIIILQGTTKEKYFYLDANPQKLCEMKLLGERVAKPNLDMYTVFIQSIGLGNRHLAKGSHLLYEVLKIAHGHK